MARTTKQAKADELDADIYRLQGRLESAGYPEAAQNVARARYYVRQDMHREDIATTSWSDDDS